jgi:hypothetical protein
VQVPFLCSHCDPVHIVHCLAKKYTVITFPVSYNLLFFQELIIASFFPLYL